MKFLLDTNVVVKIEDNHQVDEAFSTLVRKLQEHHLSVYIDQAVREDVQRDKDEVRRAITLSKLDKFESLRPAHQSLVDRLIEQTGAPLRPNDENDIRLLASIAGNAADFLITEDLGLHRRARRAELSERVVTVSEAVKFVSRMFDATEIALPYIKEIKAYQIDRSDKIFQTLREDYGGFDKWFEEKCAKEHRDCWIIEDGVNIAGILIPKSESQKDTTAKSKAEKILKICTFKLQPEYRGEKFGEQLLKKALWHAQTNQFELVYLTAFEKHAALINLIERFGFKKTYRNERGEDVFEKEILHSEILLPDKIDALQFDRLIYPRFVETAQIRKFVIPIRPEYHKVLFPEISYAAPLPLFGLTRQDLLTRKGKSDRTPGNAIRKIYLCHSNNTNLRSGDIILFYQSKNEEFANSQSVTTLGIVETVQIFTEIGSLSSHVAKRSVFSTEELRALLKRGPRVKAIDFLLVGHFDPPIKLNHLLETGVFRNRAPMSILQIDDRHYEIIKRQSRLAYGY